MMQPKRPCSVLVVSSGQKTGALFKDLLPASNFSPIRSAPTVGEAKRMLVDRPFDILIINTPLSDDFGIQFAIDAAETQGRVFSYLSARTCKIRSAKRWRITAF